MVHRRPLRRARETPRCISSGLRGPHRSLVESGEADEGLQAFAERRLADFSGYRARRRDSSPYLEGTAMHATTGSLLKTRSLLKNPHAS
jgi:hypothetical protein